MYIKKKMIDIIIVNYNSTDYLLKCLQTIFDDLGGLSANMFVQDNGSKDGADRIISLHPQIIFKKNKCNLGFSRAVNQALKQSSAPYIFILNPDTFIEKGFFDSAITYLEDHSDVGVLGPKVLDHDGSIQGSARSFPTPLTSIFGRKSPLTKLFPNNSITTSNILTTKSDGKTPMEVDWVSGACMVVRREAINDVGLLDERFFMYWEDADWCRRMREKGWKVIYFPLASIIHLVGASSMNRPIRSIYHFHKSCYRLYNKYIHWPLSISKPFALFALAWRFYIASLFHMVNCRIAQQYRLKPAEKPIEVKDKHSKIKVLRLITRMNTGRPDGQSDSLTKKFDIEKYQSRLPLKILLINQYYPPDTSATANIAYKIAEILSKKHSVTVLAGRPSYNPKNIHPWYLFYTFDQGKVKIQRVGSTAYSRHHIVGRIINYLTFILLATLRSLPNKADVFLSMTDPPIVAVIGAILSYFRRKPFCYYIQDLHPDMALASGLVQHGPLVYIWDNIHRWALRISSLIIVLGEDMRKRIIEKGIEPEKIDVVRHGATIYENLPSPDHPIVQEIRCGFSFMIIHAGNLGFYGAWNTLIEAAKLLKQENVGFVFVGDGAAKPMIKRLASSCDNVRFLPFRPLEEVPYVLAAGDIHIVTVRRGLEGMVVPSKLYPILAAGRPVLVVVPKNTDVFEIVTQNGCGIVADPDDPWSVVSAVRSLLIDRAQLKEMSCQALTAAHEYESEKQLKRFVKLIEDVSVIENVMAFKKRPN